MLSKKINWLWTYKKSAFYKRKCSSGFGRFISFHVLDVVYNILRESFQMITYKLPFYFFLLNITRPKRDGWNRFFWGSVLCYQILMIVLFGCLGKVTLNDLAVCARPLYSIVPHPVLEGKVEERTCQSYLQAGGNAPHRYARGNGGRMN